MSRVASGQPVRSYRAILSCPRCGGQLTHVATGTGGLDSRAIARCQPCRRHWGIVVTLVDVTADIGRPRAVPGRAHGTYSCYTHGCRHPECRQAASAYQRERRARQDLQGAA